MPTYDQLKQDVETGQKEQVLTEVTRFLSEGRSAQEILQEGLIAAMDIVGQKMEAEEMFIPEVLRAAKTMEAGLEVLQPHLAVGDVQVSGVESIRAARGNVVDELEAVGDVAGLQRVDKGTSVEVGDDTETGGHSGRARERVRNVCCDERPHSRRR